MKFKVGDRVKTVEEIPDLPLGWEGTITDTDEGALYPYMVTFDLDPSSMWDWPMSEQELELVE